MAPGRGELVLSSPSADDRLQSPPTVVDAFLPPRWSPALPAAWQLILCSNRMPSSCARHFPNFDQHGLLIPVQDENMDHAQSAGATCLSRQARHFEQLPRHEPGDVGLAVVPDQILQASTQVTPGADAGAMGFQRLAESLMQRSS